MEPETNHILAKSAQKPVNDKIGGALWQQELMNIFGTPEVMPLTNILDACRWGRFDLQDLVAGYKQWLSTAPLPPMIIPPDPDLSRGVIAATPIRVPDPRHLQIIFARIATFYDKYWGEDLGHGEKLLVPPIIDQTSWDRLGRIFATDPSDQTARFAVSNVMRLMEVGYDARTTLHQCRRPEGLPNQEQVEL